MKESNSLYMGIYHSTNFLLFLFTFGVSFITLRIFFQNRFLELSTFIQFVLYVSCTIILLISSMTYASFRTTKNYFVEKEAVVSLISTIIAFGLLIFMQLRRSNLNFQKGSMIINYIKLFTNNTNIGVILTILIIGVIYYLVNKLILDVFTMRNIKKDMPMKKKIIA